MTDCDHVPGVQLHLRKRSSRKHTARRTRISLPDLHNQLRLRLSSCAQAQPRPQPILFSPFCLLLLMRNVALWLGRLGFGRLVGVMPFRDPGEYHGTGLVPGMVPGMGPSALWCARGIGCVDAASPVIGQDAQAKGSPNAGNPCAPTRAAQASPTSEKCIERKHLAGRAVQRNNVHAHAVTRGSGCGTQPVLAGAMLPLHSPGVGNAGVLG